ncbi:conjugative transposon protein TraM [Adhaeribacter aquaticus]|uniref:conjugative transposon protein TraM n=1 Tax=Adhaeribacter aquaticus TaxID=299567 RepID=UPI00041A62F8|nr:conjugative transposon protein TraM [Adhaeribacter aquaticus]
MENPQVQHSQEFLNKRKMAMVLPIIIVPFLSIMFYLFGGGTPEATATMQATGLNTEVPKPTENKTNSIGDKLSVYKQKEDQEAEEERMRSLDDYSGSSIAVAGNSVSGGLDTTSATEPGSRGLAYTPAPRRAPMQRDRHEYEHLNRKVNTFYREPANNSSVSDAKIDRLIELMEREQGGSTASMDVDKELKNHPYLQYLQRTLTSGQFVGEKPVKQVQDTTSKKPAKRQIVEVAGHQEKTVNKLPQMPAGEKRAITTERNSFYSLGTNSGNLTGNTISAVIHDDQTLVNGSTVKMRLLSDINLHGTVVPKNSFIYGVASVKNERLEIAIENIRYNKDIVPVDLQVYDNDGMLGVYIPGSVDRTAGKQALAGMASGGNYNVSMATGVKEQLTMQAAQTGIEGVKTLASKKAREVKVFVKANYRVYLKTQS